MAVDQIIPARAAAFSNTSPDQIGVAARVDVLIRLQSNVASMTPISGTQDGIPFNFAASAPPFALMTAQSTVAENGIYTPSPVGGASVAAAGTFDVSGNYIKTGLTVGRLYYVTINHPGERVTNGTFTLTESGGILPAGDGSLTFQNGANGATNTNTINEAKWVRAPLYDQPNEFPTQMVVRVQFGTDAKTWWNLRQTVPLLGSSPIYFDKILPSSHADFGILDDPFTNADP